MRQLADLLNSFAGTAARLPSGLPLTTSPGVPGSRGSMGAVREAGPPPLSAAAAAAFPALRAAEAALEAKLADDAAACVADYVRLHVLNERLGARRSFRAAEACRGLNRCGAQVSADRPGGSARVLHAVVPCHPGFVQTLLCALHDSAVSVAAPLLLLGYEHPCLL